MKIKIIIIILTLLHAAVASSAFANSSICDSAARSAARKMDVPEKILHAIARVESGRTHKGDFSPWPWTVNRGGDGQFFETQKDAETHVEQSLNIGESNIDIGCFQINWRWHNMHFRSLSEMFDPQINADYAATFLRNLYNETGDWQAAIAAYHSRNPVLANAYLDKISRFTDAPPEQKINSYPLFYKNGQPILGSLVYAASPRALKPLFLR